MHLRIALLAAVLIPAAQKASAEFPLCKLLHHHHHRHDGCDDCQVHVHFCKPSDGGQYQPQADLPAAPQPSQQMMYSQVLPSTVGYTMPMMPAMSMPMMMPYPVQQASLGAPQQQYAPPQQQQRDSACSGCEDRVARLEEGVEKLSERMDRIELILENQTIAMERIHATLVEAKLVEKTVGKAAN